MLLQVCKGCLYNFHFVLDCSLFKNYNFHFFGPLSEKDRRLRKGLLAKNEAAESSSYRTEQTNRRSRRGNI